MSYWDLLPKDIKGVIKELNAREEFPKVLDEIKDLRHPLLNRVYDYKKLNTQFEHYRRGMPKEDYLARQLYFQEKTGRPCEDYFIINDGCTRRTEFGDKEDIYDCTFLMGPSCRGIEKYMIFETSLFSTDLYGKMYEAITKEKHLGDNMIYWNCRHATIDNRYYFLDVSDKFREEVRNNICNIDYFSGQYMCRSCYLNITQFINDCDIVLAVYEHNPDHRKIHFIPFEWDKILSYNRANMRYIPRDKLYVPLCLQ